MAQPGDVLAERWRLVEKIDAGAMGEIFRGAHAVLGHAVAVKVMVPEIARDSTAIERFMREARIAARLQHRNVVRVEDYGLGADGRPFIVMELLRGESLARRLCRPRTLAWREVLAIVRQLAAALDAAHAAGIIHRDLKPENVFLVDEEDDGFHVKVLDFGVAKFTDALSAEGAATASNALIGTPRYMSPEQARSSRELDGRSDLWALGMLTYEMLTGHHPFDGEAIAELLVAILTHKVTPPTAHRSDLPAAIDVWMERALARNKHQRFPTGRELYRALEHALAGHIDHSWAPMYTEGARARRNTPRKATLRVERRRTTTDPHGPPPTTAEAELAAVLASTPAPPPIDSLPLPSKHQGEPAQSSGREQDVSRTEGDVSRTEGDVSRTEGDVSRTEGNLSRTEGDVSRTEGDVSRTDRDESSGEISLERMLPPPSPPSRTPWLLVVTAVIAATLGAAVTALRTAPSRVATRNAAVTELPRSQGDLATFAPRPEARPEPPSQGRGPEGPGALQGGSTADPPGARAASTDASPGAEPSPRIRHRGRRDPRARPHGGEYDPPGI